MRSLLEGESHGYQQSHVDTIVIVNVTASIISLIGSLFVILNYQAIPSLRRQLAHKLIFWIAFSDLIHALSNCMGAPTDPILCTIQGMMVQFGSIASIFWVVAVSWTINYLMTTKDIKRGSLKRIFYIMHIIIWSLSAATTIIPLFTNSYGAAGGWCWFKQDKMIDTIWRYALFYGILWIFIVYMIFIYIKTWIGVKNMHMNQDDAEEDSDISGFSIESPEAMESHTEMSVSKQKSIEQANTKLREENQRKKRTKALKRMILFPLILIIGYLFGSIRRITDLITGSSPFWLAVIQVLMNSLIGFFDALVYGMTKDVRKKDKELLHKYCGCCGAQNQNDSYVE